MMTILPSQQTLARIYITTGRSSKRLRPSPSSDMANGMPMIGEPAHRPAPDTQQPQSGTRNQYGNEHRELNNPCPISNNRMSNNDREEEENLRQYQASDFSLDQQPVVHPPSEVSARSSNQEEEEQQHQHMRFSNQENLLGCVSNQHEENEASILAAQSAIQAQQQYHVGMLIDVLDEVEKWSEAEVLQLDSERNAVKVTYIYWNHKFDEWIDVHSSRISPFKLHTWNGQMSDLKLNQRIEGKLDSDFKEATVVEFNADRTQVRLHWRTRANEDTWVPISSVFLRPFGRHKDLSAKHQQHSPALQAPSCTKRSALAPLTNHSNRVHDCHNNPPSARSRPLSSIDPYASHRRAIGPASDSYTQYESALAREHLGIFPVEGDGNCLFRAVSHQMYGTDEHHMLIRENCMAYMDVEKRYFEPYVVGDFLRYLQVKRLSGVWGDDPEVQALCEIYDRPAEIWSFDAGQGAKKLRTFHEAASGFSGQYNRAPMLLSYYGGGHYDSIVSSNHRRWLMSHEPPGAVENRAIEMARQRGIAESSGGVEEMKRQSDEAATEQAQLDAILRASRGNFDSCTDLETALEASAQANMQAHLQRSLAEHEENEVRKAKEESMKVSNEDEMLQAAIKQSMGETDRDEDVEYQQALQLSMAGQDEGEQWHKALRMSMQAQRARGDSQRECFSESLAYEDDPELAAAIAMSMKTA